MRDIKPIAGEWFRFFIRSDTRHHVWHLVDLESFDFNGACGCEAFMFRFAPDLERGKRDNEMTGIYQCKHIQRAQLFFARVMVKEMADRLITNTNTRKYVVHQS